MDLCELRQEIDQIDQDLLELFVKRLNLAPQIAQVKADQGLAVFDPARERDKIFELVKRSPAEFQAQVQAFFSLIISMNRSRQMAYLAQKGGAQVLFTQEDRHTVFPSMAHVACQGVEGAYSQIAASKLFSLPKMSFFESFEGVCRAVRDGFCEYGVLPIENSSAGSVNAVYDLLGQYQFYIVRALRLKIDHNLLVKPGVARSDIREVLSHEQALSQCSRYLQELGAQDTVVQNTAVAARMVAESKRRDIAAIASRKTAELYSLEVCDQDIQDTDYNYTRFVVISKKPEIYPGASRTSIKMSLAHEPGSLYRVLERFYSLGINLVKLESRPVPGRDFEFSFYFDLECPLESPAFSQLVASLADISEDFVYFGTYTEVLL